MQRQTVCAAVGILVAFASAVSVHAQGAQQAPIRPETIYPRHIARGHSTVVNVAVPSPQTVEAAEISPSTGVTVGAIKGTHSGSEQNVGWWEITLDVAGDAAPGDRSLVLVMRTARTAPITVSVPAHVPTISDLRVVPPQGNQPTFELRFAAADAAGDLGASPYVWLTADCGGEPIVGAVGARASAGVVEATVPNLRTAATGAGKCDVHVRVTDTAGIESNTLTTTVELPVTSAAPVAATAATSSSQDWTEFSAREDRFTVIFPGQPKVTTTTWMSQYGAILPARVYSGTQASGRYSVTVVDYNPIERLLCERARTLPALDLAIYDYGIGYWKTDVRSAVLYAAAKYLERDGKVSNLFSNFADGVAGLQLQFTSSADQSRTYTSIYMHENRLILAEATVPKGYPAPLIFQQSLGWLDDNGTRIRYQFMYHNDPNAPKPPIRGR